MSQQVLPRSDLAPKVSDRSDGEVAPKWGATPPPPPAAELLMAEARTRQRRRHRTIGAVAGGAVAGAAIALVVVLAAAQGWWPLASNQTGSGDAALVGDTGAVTITGYKIVAPFGSFNPVTVSLSAAAAQRLRGMFHELRWVSSPRATCEENALLFRVSFAEPHGRTFRAVGLGCAGDQIYFPVSREHFRVPGTEIAVDSSCRLLQAVAAELPPGKGSGTRNTSLFCTRSDEPNTLPAG
jgi:hypothetical protein